MNEDKHTRHRRLQRRQYVLQAASLLVVLLALSVLPSLVPLAWTGPWRRTAVLLVVGTLVALASAPWSWSREVSLERRAGRPAPTTTHWLRRHTSQWALTMLCGLPVWLLFTWLQDVAPWLVVPTTAAAVAAGSLLVLAVAPWLVTWSPRVAPLADEALAGRLHALVGRAGLRVSGVHAWSDPQAAVEPNAALLGAGPGRRLLLSTSLLELFAPDEVDVVVAHELGHHARGHLWKRLRLQWLVVSVLCAAGQGVGMLRTVAGRPNDDTGALALMLVTAGLIGLLARPHLLRQSRAHEVEADDFALQLTGRPDVFERILTRLGAHYTAAPAPSPFETAFFLTHPPVRQRIMRVRDWRAT